MKGLVRMNRPENNVPFFRNLDRFFDGDVLAPFEEWSGPWKAEGRWYPAMDVEENDDAFMVTAELPGLEKRDIELTVEDNRLTLHGEREWKGDKDKFHRVERAYGKFTRMLALPGHVDSKAVKADFKDGILKVTIPKAEQAKAKKIEIR